MHHHKEKIKSNAEMFTAMEGPYDSETASTPNNHTNSKCSCGSTAEEGVLQIVRKNRNRISKWITDHRLGSAV